MKRPTKQHALTLVGQEFICRGYVPPDAPRIQRGKRVIIYEVVILNDVDIRFNVIDMESGIKDTLFYDELKEIVPRKRRRTTPEPELEYYI